jgi:ferredoxin
MWQVTIVLMKIVVDPNKCISCNMCEDISDGAMGTKYGKEGISAQNPEADLTDRVVVANVKLAIETCPMQAIKLED